MCLFLTISSEMMPLRFAELGASQSPLLTQETTIIAGGGSIGLATAYYLALGCKTSNRSCRVIVVDAFEGLWNSSSSHNTGVISQHIFEDVAKKTLGAYSFSLFRNLSNDEEFRRFTSIKDHTIYNVADAGHGFRRSVPGWANLPDDWYPIPQPPEDGTAMTLKPKGLGSWLLTQCQILGVEFLKPAKVVKARLNGKGQIREVGIMKDGVISTISCQNLVLSSGAWTPSLVAQLFPHSSIDLMPETDGGSWMIIRNPDKSSTEIQTTLILSSILGVVTEFASQDDGTIWICGGRDAFGAVPDLAESGTFPPIPESIKRFSECARRFMKPFGPRNKLEILEQGLSYRPTNKLNRPIIAALPVERLDSSLKVMQITGDRSGVFVCTGHSYFGITLGLGSGKITSALILGQKPDIDIDSLNLPDFADGEKKTKRNDPRTYSL